MAQKRKKNNRSANNKAKNKNGNGGSSKLSKAAHSIIMDLADLLKSVLNSGLVAVGDVNIKIADVELPIKLRLLVTMIEKAKEEGIDWWERDSFYSSGEGLSKNKDGKKGSRARSKKR